jgi:hypothetical protein
MNLDVPVDLPQIAKILTDVRYLIKDVLLVELLNQKEEIKKLREVTWPICQALKETSQLGDIAEKIYFLNELDQNEIIHLVNEKSKFSSKGKISSSTSHLTQEELHRLTFR